MSGDELFVVIKKQLVRIDFEGECLRSVKVRHGVAVGVKDNPAAAVGAGGAHHRAVIGHGRQRFEQGLLLEEAFKGFAAGLAVNADVGYRVQPMTGGGIDGAKGGDFQTVEEVFFDIPHAVFYAPLFVAFFDLASHRGKAVVGGKVQVARIKARLHAGQVFQHAHLEVVDHNFLGHTTEELQRVSMAGEELLHALAESELHIHEPAVAQDHNKEAQPAPDRADRDRAKAAPVHLGALSSGKLQHQKGGFAHRAHQLNKLLKNAVAAHIALSLELLKDLLRIPGAVGH